MRTQDDPRIGDVADARESGTGVRKGTGRERDEWFLALDAWGAGQRGYRERVDWLMTEHGVSAWWAQKLVVEYEQARGLRIPGVRPDGTFTVTASKVVAVPVERLVDAFLERELRDGWLPGVQMRARTVQPGRSARFDWRDGTTRVAVSFAAMGEARSQAAIEHSKLPDPQSADEAKSFWHDRLRALKTLLEA